MYYGTLAIILSDLEIVLGFFFFYFFHCSFNDGNRKVSNVPVHGGILRKCLGRNSNYCLNFRIFITKKKINKKTIGYSKNMWAAG